MTPPRPAPPSPPSPPPSSTASSSQLPTGPEKTARVRAMFDTIAPRYDLVNRVMTFGLDQAWRRRTVSALALPPGALVLDLACGTGDLSRLGVRRGYRVVGADLSAGMLAANRGDTPLVEADAARLPFPDGAFDGIVCGFALRNFTDLAATWPSRPGCCGPGGRLAVLEVGAPTSRAPACRLRPVVHPAPCPARRPALRRRRLPLPPAVGGVPAGRARAAPHARPRPARRRRASARWPVAEPAGVATRAGVP